MHLMQRFLCKKNAVMCDASILFLLCRHIAPGKKYSNNAPMLPKRHMASNLHSNMVFSESLENDDKMLQNIPFSLNHQRE